MAVTEEFKTNYYELLGISHDADEEEIKRAYRKLSKIHHPDLTGQEISEIQLLLNLARDALCNENIRQRHDLYWEKVNARYVAEEPTKQEKSHEEPIPTGPAPPNFPRVQEILRKRLNKALESREELLRSGFKIRTSETMKELLREQRAPRIRFFLFLFLTLANIALGIIYRPLFVLILIPLGFLISSLRSGSDPEHMPAFGPLRKNRLQEKARILSRSHVNQEIRGLDTYHEKLDFIMKLLRRREKVEKPDKLLFSKIAICLYLLDFRPKSHEPQKSQMVFCDGNQDYLIHCYSKYNKAIDVGYIKKIIIAMKRRKISQGILFSLSGVSAVARTFAHFNHLQVYSREEINHWIAQATLSKLPGFEDNIIEKLDELWNYLKKITLKPI